METTETTLSHDSLDAILTGVKVPRNGVDTLQFRGLQFARIKRRFAKPEEVTVGDAAERATKGGKTWMVNAREFG